MVNTKTVNGVHRPMDEDNKYTQQELILMKTQDIGYVLQKLQIERKKVEKLSAMLHSIDNKPLNSHVYFVDDRFMYVTPPDTDVYSIPKVLAQMPQKYIRCAQSDFGCDNVTEPPVSARRDPLYKYEREIEKVFLRKHYKNRRLGDPEFVLDFEEIYVIDSKTKSITRAKVLFRKAPQGSPRKVAAQKQVLEAMSHKMHIDDSVKLVGKLLFGMKKGPEVLTSVRPAGQPLVDDWDCLKTLVPYSTRSRTKV
ncbi:hypothetical protein P8452_52862 [Trifolium repens]|nr:hypothetical protein P8452_52862 [Trifolium repens]